MARALGRLGVEKTHCSNNAHRIITKTLHEEHTHTKPRKSRIINKPLCGQCLCVYANKILVTQQETTLGTTAICAGRDGVSSGQKLVFRFGFCYPFWSLSLSVCHRTIAAHMMAASTENVVDDMKHCYENLILIDASANLTNKKYSRDLDAVVQRAQDSGMEFRSGLFFLCHSVQLL